MQALHDGAEALKTNTPNFISLNAGCELFIAFVTLFPHESDVRPQKHTFFTESHSQLWVLYQNFTELKAELYHQGQKYTAEALSYRAKIAELTLGFIKDDSVVRYAYMNFTRWML